VNFNFFFTLTAETTVQREWLDRRTGDLAEITRLSVLADDERRLPCGYHFSGRIDVAAMTAALAETIILQRIEERVRPRDVGLAWPPEDFEVVPTEIPLRGTWLFEDLPVERQEWLAHDPHILSITGTQRGFDLYFEDRNHERWLYSLNSPRSREDHWRFVAEGIRQLLRVRSAQVAERVDHERQLENAPAVGEVLLMDI
jgi:hypothetical protein